MNRPRSVPDTRPVAVIGVACRLPGAPDPAALWNLLAEGRSAIRETPRERATALEPGHPGTRFGGYLEDIAGFDTEFFGISPLEAAATDPQQRLVLELAWEALEDAGIVPATLRDTATGVFVGAIADEYAVLSRTSEPGRHTLTGTTRGIIANRVSYTLGLTGPSIAVDTAQSSSLVAVHLACESLRRGESALALAGGVNLIVDPDGTAAVARFGALSPDGHCHTFDRRANGYVRGEGAGLVLLKPLEDALADGDHVYAVIAGGAVNNDGATGGLTVPSAEAQAEVIRRACAASGLAPADLRYVELHGTGTPLGDPIEARGLGLARGGDAPVVQVGSVKTNVGHLEGAAGITGLLKTVLSIDRRHLPATLGHTDPNPAIDLDAWRLAVRTQAGPWPEGPLVAGVSSWGMGGTNCHLVLTEAPAPDPAPARGEPRSSDEPLFTGEAGPLLLSARSEAALRGQAARLRDTLTEGVPDGLGRALATTRTAFTHRAALTGDALQGLEALAAGRPAPGVRTGRASTGHLAVLFPGQGSQRPGMGSTAAAYREAFAEVAELLDARLPQPIGRIIDGPAENLNRTAFTQPALFAVEVASYRLLRSLGARPSFVAGHSIGEVAAAHVAGILDLASAVELITARGRLMDALPEGGTMLAVGASETAVTALIGGEGAAVAAVNGPEAVVVSGERAAVEQIAARAAEHGYRTRRLEVSHAFHSPLMEPMLADFREVLDGLDFGRARIPFVSTVTGGLLETTDAGYWVEHARRPVRFTDGLRRLRDLGADVFVEAGPGAVLSGLGKEATGAAFVPLLGRDGDPAAAVAGLYTAGVPLDWEAVYGRKRTRVPLPTYAFQREPHWLDGTARPRTAPAVPAATPGAPQPADLDLEARVLAEIAAALGFTDPARIDREATFQELGLDSLGLVGLRERLGELLDADLPAATLFAHPTATALVEHLSGAPEQAQTRAARAADDDPVVIVGMGCRYPGGVASPEDLWELLAEGRDVIGDFPDDRGWDPQTLDTATRRGGFLHGAGEFDAAFFGISPREALAIDPQQRLLLQVAWEALERAGIDPLSLKESDTGVFIGATTSDYTPRLHEGDGSADGYLLTGGTMSVASGRIAYVLGLRGPALTVDTACSSSLVALDLAVRAVRSGETGVALAGGAAVMATPGMFVEFSRQRGLSPDGRCKAFGAAADGTGWAEGVGVLVVERLSLARAHGHRVLAVIAGSAVNQDGASNGLTAPNGRAQEQVIARALADAGLSPADVDAVEAHGTGTTLGDPIEAHALSAAYGRDRERPLLLGSLKSNLGHTQAAAGVGGVIKMVQALQHAVLPRTLHADEPSPHITWTESGLSLLTEQTAWPDTGRPRRAAVSSFGISGTNAHLILQQAPPETPAEEPPAQAPPLLLSAADPASLARHADAVADHLAARPDLAATAGTLLTRARLRHGAAVLSGEPATATAALRALASGEPHADLVTAERVTGRTVFVFPGQGSQWPAMARGLLEHDPAFRAEIEACAAAFAEHTDWSLTAVLRGEEGAPPLERVDVVQPVLFAVMAALAAAWRAAGVIPDAVVGHSQGEIAAAYVAGALDLADAARLIVLRSRALRRITGNGGMVSVALPAQELTGLPDGLEIAVRNGPRSTVVAGPDALLDDLLARAEREGFRARRVPVDYASHTAFTEPLRAELLEAFAGLAPRPAATAFCSTVTAGTLDTTNLDADYWYRNLRRTVRFEEAVGHLIDTGHHRFVEISAHPVLTFAIEEILAARTVPGTVQGTLRRDHGGPEQLRRALAAAHLSGADVTWPRPPADPALPTYPFARDRYWLTPSARGPASSGHPLIETAVALADDALLVTGRIDPAAQPWLADHAVRGRPLVPGTVLAELAARAGEQAGAPEVAELTVRAPLPLHPARLQLLAGPPDPDGRRAFDLHARPADDQPWTLHASGVLAPAADTGTPYTGPGPGPDAAPIDLTGIYDRLFRLGYDYGPAFQGLSAAWRTGGVLHAEVSGPDGEFAVHPALLDAALHPVVAGLLGAEPERPLLPFAFEGLRLERPASGILRVRIEPLSADRYRFSFTDADGRPVGEIASLAFRPLAAEDARPLVHHLTWEPLPEGSAAPFAVLHGLGGTDLLTGPHPIVTDLADAPPTVLVPLGPAAPDEASDEAEGTAGAARARTAAVLDLIQETLPGTTRLVFAVAEDDLASAPVRGLVRTAAAEHPGRFALAAVTGSAPAALLAADHGEPEVAVRGGKVLGRRLTAATSQGPPRPVPEGTVLITGGTGGLGSLVARRFAAAENPPHLLLAGRSGITAPGAPDLVAELTSAGATVTVAACDVTDRAALRRLLADIPPERPLRAVVHTAGLLADATVANLTRARLADALRPKIDAAWHLHELTLGLPLERFDLFSSAVAALGVPGQGNYAAGNAFLDALAEHRHRLGLPAASLAWGVWDEASAMTGHLTDADRTRLARLGVGGLATEEALDVLDRAEGPYAFVSPLEETLLREEAAAGRLPALFSRLVRRPGRARRQEQGAWARRLLAERPEDRRRTAVALLREQVAAVLGHTDPSALGSALAFKDLGFDSLTAVELRTRLTALTGLSLPATIVFEFPTITELAHHLASSLEERPVTAAPVTVRAAASSDDPVVIVGMGCRYPGGAASPEELWELVFEGRDVIGDFPDDRGWNVEALFHPDPDHRGTSSTRRGGFLHGAGEFDAAFFGMSPREALATDPQQRLLLQVAWEALERAGIDPLSLKESDTGVFVGAMYDDYAARLHAAPEELEGLLLAGNQSSVASGRIAYQLGLRGPALTVDTACSSSLVALDLAVRAIRSGEVSMALAGGVAVMATPGMFVEFSRQRGLSPDGRCKAFGAAADGTGWSEGVGMLVVERLSRAREHGHRVLAVIAGSAVNQDGASNGLTAPNGRAQEQVITRALADAGLSPGDVDAVEAHGTGTVLGDPIEAHALIAAYGRDRETPLLLGSLKSNLGHTQAAAGVGGVIKMVQALHHGVLPRTLHADEPSPHVEWDPSVALLTERTAWPETGRPRRAGVSSFGISGTNAHLILQQAPPEPGRTDESHEAGPLVLSAKTETALRAQAAALHELFTGPAAPDPAGVSLTLARRSRFPHRAVLEPGPDLPDALAALRDGRPHPLLVTGTAREEQRLAALFSGQGSQRTGMALELLAASPRFAEAFDAVADGFGLDLRGLLADEDGPLHQTRYAQPALFAVEVALYRLAESHGLRPDHLIGHSIGELAAAHVAGVLDLAATCTLVAARGRLMQSARQGGAMAAFDGTEQQITDLAGGAADLAAVNGPGSVVLSGDAATIDELVARWKAGGRRATRLKVSHAFHSAHMDEVLAEFREVASGLVFHPARLPVISTVTGTVAAPEDLADPDYWTAQIRRPVRFADAVRAARKVGVTCFVELGPDGTLAAHAGEDGALAVPVLRRDRPEVRSFREALARLHTAGVPVDHASFVSGARPADLPTYPFQTRRYWLLPDTAPATPADLGLDAAPHPLLGGSTDLPDGGRLFTGVLSTERTPWLADHRIGGRALAPAALLAELALAVGAATGRPHLADLTLDAPIVLDGEVRLQLTLTGSGELTFRTRREDTWTTHATATLTDTDAAPAPSVAPIPDAPGVLAEGVHAALAGHGYDYGPAFRGLTAAWSDGDTLYAEAALPPLPAAETTRHLLHPALLDAALHTLPLHGLDGPSRIPYGLEGVRLHTAHATAVRARLTPLDADSYRLELTDRDGRPVLTADRLRLRPLPTAARLYELRWHPADTVDDAPGPVAQPQNVAEALALVQEHLSHDLPEPLTVRTHGLATEDDEPASREAAAIWGLVGAAQAEHPGRLLLIDGKPNGGEPTGRVGSGGVGSVSVGVSRAAVRDGRTLTPRLVPLTAEPGGEPLWPRSAEGGTVLVTGGTGAVGRAVARHLAAAHGVRNLLLAGRRGAGHPDAAEIEEELSALGAHPAFAALDLTDRDALAALLDAVPLTGVVHAAGITGDATVTRLDPETLHQVIAVKADTARHLDELTRGRDLDAFVAFGSVAAVLGTAGQAAYAAANASLEAVTRARRLAGERAVTLHWGLWDLDGGMAADLSERDLVRLADAGIRPMAEHEALSLLDTALATGRPALVAARLDRVPAALTPPVTTTTTTTTTTTNAAAATVREARTGPLVLEAIAAVLGYGGAAEIDTERTFAELGVDSLTAVELRNRLSSVLGVRLPGAVIFDHPTPRALIDHLERPAGLDDPGHDREEPAPAAVSADEPIAIVGMACRFPGGVRTPADLWELLEEGRDAITAFPDDRGWDPALYDPDPERTGTSTTRYGGFLHDAAEFDPEFFGISPREALAVDPQQRLLLQAAWEAVEDAGIDPASLRGSQSGVFVGVMYSDYGARVHQRPGAARELEGYLVSGSAGSVASGRISYTLGLEGPAVTIDTACSSSLVAVHQAAQALRLGECSLALAGGATVMASPATFVEFSRQRGLADDGRCKPFSAAADGTAWGEGAGLLVLQRLSDALRDGRRVLAVVRGSAVNQDGASNGLTAPNGPSQERVIRGALRGAGLRPRDVDVLEAHGTGTRLGDPIEAGAVLNTYGGDRNGRPPLLMGSVKSNLGHTQAAAGVAGIIKSVLAMRHGRVPATLHLDGLSEHVDWSPGTVDVPAATVPWPDGPGPRRAAVSSFGISGTNAHVILEQGPPEPAREHRQEGSVVPWVLSARTEDGVREQAERLHHRVLADPQAHPADVAYALATTRTAFDHRAVILGRSREELLAGLDALRTGAPAGDGFPLVVTGTAARGATAVLFTGQGSQRADMAEELREAFPVFARAFDEVTALFREQEGLDVPAAIADPSLIDQTRHTQAALFTVEVALFRLLESLGLRAELLAGHSIGELAAAHLSGALALADAVTLVGLRGRLMQECPEGGLMHAVQADPETVRAVLAETGAAADIAAVNGPEAVVVSGDADAVETVTGLLRERGHRVRPLTVSHAFHSAHMDPAAARFRDQVDTVATGTMGRTVVSTLTGREAGPELLGSGTHWADQVRGTVRFADALRRLRELGAVRFLEVGPDAALTALLRQTDETRAHAVMDRRHPDTQAFWTFVAGAYVAGADWDWRALLGPDAAPVPLPTYPFRRERLWLMPPAADGTAAGIGADEPAHPLLAASVTTPDASSTFHTGVLSHRRQPWLADHALRGVPLLPAAALADLTARLAAEHGHPAVRELSLHAPVLIGATEEIRLRVSVTGPHAQIHTRPADAEEWTLNAEAVLGETEPGPAWAGERPAAARPVDLSGLYPALAARGYDYGSAFQGLRALWRDGTDSYAEVATEDGTLPGLIDAAFHAWIADGDGPLLVPYAFRDLRIHGEPRGPLRVRLRRTGEDAFALDAVDERGRPAFSAGEVRARQVEAAALLARRTTALRPYEVAWVQARLDAAPAGRTVVLGDPIPGLALEAVPVPDGTEDVIVAAAPEGGIRTSVLAVRDLILTLPERARLVVLTRGALAATPGDRVEHAEQAALWGLVRTARQERPGRVGIVDADDHPDTLTALPRLLASAPGQLAVRRGTALRPRLRALPASPAPDGRSGPDLGAETVLVTGAGGALGSAIARHLAGHRLLLVSRRGDADPGLAALGAELDAEVAACDLADSDAVAELLRGRTLSAVVHSAGVLADAVLDNLTADDLDRVLRPKTDAAWNLHRHTEDQPLRAFVLFSSIAGVVGNAGQAAYAAANTALDALAQRRRAEGLPATSLAWGLWEDGMAAALDPAARARIDRLGIRPLAAAEGLELFDRSLDADAALLVTARLAPAASPGLPEVLADLAPARPAPPRETLGERVAGLDREAALDLVRGAVAARIAEVLGLDGPARVPDDRGLFDLGLDSLTAVELRNRLSADLGERLPTTVLFDQPTVRALGAHLLDLCEPARPGYDPQVLAAWIAAADGDGRAELARALKDALSALDTSEEDDFGMDSASDDELFGLLDRELSD
ncbi:type I polyketide synthase [Actinocorallia libanotica]|uniref:Type I polyketide synthase n=1 Tax=Actinocorallia libanotica TaxID=46162 RepID=A0ABN1R728_9ACTN